MKNEFNSWGDFISAIRSMPKTWVPAALLVIVEEAITRDCFKEEMLLRAIEEKLNYMKDPSRKWEQL